MTNSILKCYWMQFNSLVFYNEGYSYFVTLRWNLITKSIINLFLHTCSWTFLMPCSKVNGCFKCSRHCYCGLIFWYSKFFIASPLNWWTTLRHYTCPFSDCWINTSQYCEKCAVDTFQRPSQTAAWVICCCSFGPICFRCSWDRRRPEYDDRRPSELTVPQQT